MTTRPPDVLIRPAEPGDAAHWVRLRQAFWPAPAGEHAAEAAAYFAGDRANPATVLLAFGADGTACGFAELSIRTYAEDCYSGRVAYLEGWYVVPAWRRRGVGQALLHAGEDWGRAQGCTEMASDTQLDNQAGAAAHQALGFVAVRRIICYRKDL